MHASSPEQRHRLLSQHTSSCKILQVRAAVRPFHNCAAPSLPHVLLTMGQEKKLDTIVTVRPVHLRTMSGDSTHPKRFRDEEDDETSSQISSTISLEELEAGRSQPRWYRRSESSTLRRWFGAASPSKSSKKRAWCRWLVIAVVIVGLFGVIAGM
jgi:hypothetical protein